MRIEGLIRMLVFRYGFRFLKKGANHLSRPRDADGNLVDKKAMTPEQREQTKRARQNTNKAAKAARLAAKASRFKP